MKLGGQVEVGDLEYTTYIRSRFACEYRGKHSLSLFFVDG